MAEINLYFTELYKVYFLIPGVLQNSVLVLLVFLITTLFCSCASKDCLHKAKQIDSKPDFLLQRLSCLRRVNSSAS